MPIHVAIDIGGTFTDVVAREGSALHATKVPTTPDDLVSGVRNGIGEIIKKTTEDRSDVSRFVHGTTAGTNAIVEQEGGTVGVLMTEGYRDTLEIGRQKRNSMYDVFIDPQTPVFLAPRERRAGIKERLDKDGDVVRPLDEEQVVDTVGRFVNEHDVDSIAVCYLFSFRNQEHEKRTKELIEEHFPDVQVSLSSEINPKFREYERLVVTAFDAYLRPVIAEYIDEMNTMLHDEDIECELQIMQSRGGITNSRQIIEKPLTTALSGPAAAVAGAAEIGSYGGYENLITIDIGGTSSDVSLVIDGKPQISGEGELSDYPLRMQMVDINAIGAGGGSIAWLDQAGSLHVGPKSSGADPGPACYDRGGTEPTITDASLLLGYLNPDYFADGTLDLSVENATNAIESEVADPLGYDLIEAAKGIHNIINTKMAEQLRLHTVKQGFDPREFNLFAMGGAGPVHAAWLAEELQVPKVIVPRTPGVLSASGLLYADIEHDHEATYSKKLDDIQAADLEDAYAALIEEGNRAMQEDGVSPDEVAVTRQADMRYIGQSFEISMDIPFDPITPEDIEAIEERFHTRHTEVYGHANRESRIEFVDLRVVHTHTPEKMYAKPEATSQTLQDALKEHREMHFVEHGAFDAPVYKRHGLPIGERFVGPAVVEQADTTTVIYPGQTGEIDEHGNLVISTSVGGEEQ